MRTEIGTSNDEVPVTRRSWTLLVSAVLVLILAVVSIADADRGKRGPRGPQGRTGERGPQGEPGRAGEAAPGVLKQNIAINWQNDVSEDSTQLFTAPRIGTGEVRCTEPIQRVRFFPFDQRADTALWTVRIQRPSARGDAGDVAESVVRTARKGYDADPVFTGPDYHESMSVSLDGSDPKSTGTFIGQISSAGPHDTPGGPGPRTTTFQLSWHWNFTDGNPRCYVAGSFETGTGS